MSENKFLVSAPQVFCSVFFYLLSGMMLFCGGSLPAALFSALFCALLCAVHASLCGESSSFRLYNTVFGKCGTVFRYIAAFFASLPFCRTLLALSASAAVFHSGISSRALAPALAILCLFAVAKGFTRAARFCELCVFPLILAVLLSLLGGEGSGLSFNLGADTVFSAFEIIGAAPIFLSLYLRSATAQNGKISVYAENSTFRPSPLSAGVFASLSAPCVYAYFCLTGVGNILFSFLAWFFALARLSVFTLTLAELLAFPEKGKGAQSAFVALAFSSFWLIFANLFPNITRISQALAVLLPPFAILAMRWVKKEKILKRHTLE